MPVINSIAAMQDEMAEWRQDIHAHPELAFEEVRTAQLVAEKLESWGIEVTRGLGKTGLVGTLKGREPGSRSIGLRADMDALPLQELVVALAGDSYRGPGKVVSKMISKMLAKALCLPFTDFHLWVVLYEFE